MTDAQAHLQDEQWDMDRARRNRDEESRLDAELGNKKAPTPARGINQNTTKEK